MRGTSSKLIWIDSSVNTHGDKTSVLVPSHPFDAHGNEKMSLTLLQFSLRRNFYNINPTNNVAYIYINGTYHEWKITPGVYHTFDLLRAAIQTGLSNAIVTIPEITSVAVTYNSVTRLYTIDFTVAAGHTTR